MKCPMYIYTDNNSLLFYPAVWVLGKGKKTDPDALRAYVGWMGSHFSIRQEHVLGVNILKVKMNLPVC